MEGKAWSYRIYRRIGQFPLVDHHRRAEVNPKRIVVNHSYYEAADIPLYNINVIMILISKITLAFCYGQNEILLLTQSELLVGDGSVWTIPEDQRRDDKTKKFS